MINTVYIASSIKYEEKCLEIAKLLAEEFGITITRKWWYFYTKDSSKYKDMVSREFYSKPIVQMIRELDFRAIRDADMVIIITEHGHKPTGALVECGYAIALNKIVVFLGEIKRSVMLSGCIHINTYGELAELIERDRC